MKIIVLSGGSGNRQWPLSNRYRAKSYLSVLEGPSGNLESMVQRLWRQLETADLLEHTRFLTCRQQAEPLQEQIGAEAPLIIEPEQRGSFPSAALAASYLYSVIGASLDETIMILPSDTYVENDFFHYISSLPKLLRASESELMMIGIKPNSRDGRYGYIIPDKYKRSGARGLFEYKVQNFREKPCESEVESLFKEDVFWNSKTYAFKLEFMISYLMERGLPVQYDELHKWYKSLPRSSFEAEVINKDEVSKSVVLFDGLWRDMSSWKTLSEKIMFRRLDTAEFIEGCKQEPVIPMRSAK